MAFFSGTDINDLVVNHDKYDYYLSLVVNVAKSYVAKLAFAGTTKVIRTFKENGVIVEPKSINSLVDGIKNLIIDKKKLKQIQIYNHQVAKKKYSLEQYIDNLNKIVMEN